MARSTLDRLATPGALIALGTAGIWFALRVPTSYDGATGARILPLAASGVLLILALADLRRGMREPSATSSAAPGRLRDVLAMLALAALYLWLIGRFGYLISTAFAAPAALWLFGIRRPLGLVLAAIICPLVYHLLFFKLLGVFPPYGAWFDLLDIFPVF